MRDTHCPTPARRTSPPRFPRFLTLALVAWVGFTVFGPDPTSTAFQAPAAVEPVVTTAPLPKPVERLQSRHGVASWYGAPFHGQPTASGEPFDMHGLTAAHRTLPFGTPVEVRNLENGRSVVVRINDRGPSSRHRLIDLSYAAARELRMVGVGTARVEVVRLAG